MSRKPPQQYSIITNWPKPSWWVVCFTPLADWRAAQRFFQPRQLKESAKERGRFIRNADNLVRCLPIEFEIEFGLRPGVIPGAKRLQLAASHAPFCQRGPSNLDADARRLPDDPGFLWNRCGGGNDT